MSRKPYVRDVATTSWWLDRPRYLRYMVREASCIFIGAYTGVLVVGLVRLAQGRVAYEGFLDAIDAPLSIVFHLIVLAFALTHSVTWFGLTPKAMPLRLAGSRVPGSAIIGAHYVGWAVVTVAILALVGV